MMYSFYLKLFNEEFSFSFSESYQCSLDLHCFSDNFAAIINSLLMGSIYFID